MSIVSAFEFLFTEVGSLVPTVQHFERYPSVRHPIDKKPATPDFSVVFQDGVGLAGRSLGSQNMKMGSTNCVHRSNATTRWTPCPERRRRRLTCRKASMYC